jgi:hypothetical protein
MNISCTVDPHLLDVHRRRGGDRRAGNVLSVTSIYGLGTRDVMCFR